MLATLVIVVVLVLFAFGISFAVTGSYPAALLLTGLSGVWTAAIVVWSRNRPVKWNEGTRVWIALAVAVYCAGLGVFSIVVMRDVWPTGILSLVSAAAFAICAAGLRRSRSHS